MPCYKPLAAFWKRGGGVTFSHGQSNGSELKLPCGQCIGCRIDRKREWALRLLHESRMHSESCFITLTYNPESLPRGGTLVKRHGQLFVKRLRDYLRYHLGPDRKIRYFLIGEYGDVGKRPHYHVIIFGWRPKDGKLRSERNGYRTYTSDALAALWPDGLHDFGEADPGSCLYVAGYAVKKITGKDMAREHYTRITADGEMIEVIPEFACMSTRPGIGAGFYDKFESDFRNHDFAILQGRKQRVPRYYDKLYERKEKHRLETVKDLRRINARKHRANNTPERLAERERVHQAKIKFTSERKALSK